MSEVATKSITISGVVVTVTAPYAEGHVLTAAEAKSLNQTRAENLRNNLAKAVAEIATGEGAKNTEGQLTAEAMAKINEVVAKYDSEYTFALSSASPKRAVDPIEAEAKKLATAAVKAKLAAAGRKVADIEKEKLDAAIAKLMENPDIQAQAKKIVQARSKTASADLADLGL